MQGGTDRRPWIDWMSDRDVWSRLVAVPPLRHWGLSHGWGPHGVAAAYRRRFRRSPQMDHRRRYVYSRQELLAVAELLMQEATAQQGTGR